MKTKARVIAYIFTGIVAAFCIVLQISTLSSKAASNRPEIGVSEDNSVSRKVPIIMYHSILPDSDKQGEYIISPRQLEQDLIWLKENGYKTVKLSELIKFADNRAELCEKVVALTFYDGMRNNLTYLLPLLNKYDMYASISVVGRYTEAAGEEAQPSDYYSYLDTDDLSVLLSSGRIELCNHSFDMHELGARQGSVQMSTESFSEYRRAFFNDVFAVQRLLKDNCGYSPVVYTYPYGFSCKAAKTLVKVCGFKASLGVEEKVNNIVQGDTDCLYDLGRFNRPSGIMTEQFMKRIME